MIIMRLLSSLKHDEAERGIFHLGRTLVKKGHTSIIIASASADDELVKRLQRDGNLYHCLAMNKKSWWSLSQIIPLRRLIKKYKPDIIHIHSRTPAWVLHWALKGLELEKPPKLVSTLYGFYPINNYSKAILEVDCLITVSDSVTDYLQKKLENTEIITKQITRIYRGVDTAKYTYRHQPSVFWLRHTFAEFPELEHKKWLLFPTLIGTQHGQEWLIDILGNLKEKFPKIHVIIMDDEQRENDIIYEEFRQRAYALGLSDRITFIGQKRNDIREWLAAANIVLALANQPESIGMNALQALHLGTPVIGWDKAAYSEILHPLYPQGLVKQINAKALCKSVKSQLENANRPTISDQFTVRQMVDETLKVYEDLYAKSTQTDTSLETDNEQSPQTQSSQKPQKDKPNDKDIEKINHPQTEDKIQT